MSKKTYENLKETLNYELDGLAKRGDINKETLDSMYKLIKSIKGLEQLCDMEEGKEMGGYSNRYSRGVVYNPWERHGNSMDGGSNAYNTSNRMPNDGYANDYSGNSYDNTSYDGGQSNARRGRDGDGDGRYSEDNSHRRGRDAKGRYTSRDSSYDRGGYSRHSARDRVIEHLEKMLDESNSNSEQIAIMKCIEELQD